MNQTNESLSNLYVQPVGYLFQFMATKMENWVGVNFEIFGSNPWRQFIVLLEICCKDTNIHENVENKISDFWFHKAQNVRACHIKKCIQNMHVWNGKQCRSWSDWFGSRLLLRPVCLKTSDYYTALEFMCICCVLVQILQLVRLLKRPNLDYFTPVIIFGKTD